MQKKRHPGCDPKLPIGRFWGLYSAQAEEMLPASWRTLYPFHLATFLIFMCLLFSVIRGGS